MQNIIIATIKEWNISNYFKLKEVYKDKYNFHLITTKDELTINEISKLTPRYIPWMWCVNGFSSLLGSIFAAIGAKLIGSHLVFVCGALCYLLAILCTSEKWKVFNTTSD